MRSDGNNFNYFNAAAAANDDYLLKLRRCGGVKEVFVAEELRTSVTSGQYRRLERGFTTAIDVRNAVIDWPSDVQASSMNANHPQQALSKPWHQLRLRGQKGEECMLLFRFFVLVNFEHLFRRNKLFQWFMNTFICQKNDKRSDIYT